MAHHQLGNLDRARSHFDAALKQYLNIPGRPLSNLKIGLAVWNMDIQYPLFGEVLSQYGWHYFYCSKVIRLMDRQKLNITVVFKIICT